MPHLITPLRFKPSRLDGLSERLLASHYENNYGAAVRRLNAIEEQLAGLGPTVAPGFLLSGLRREQLIARNSMLLHELYFAGLGGSGTPGGDLAVALERDFGSVASWRDEFVALAKALAGGSGWVLLSLSPRDGRLVNQWAADHGHCLAGALPLLALDMYEHAYHLDFGARAAAYVEAFMRNVDWDGVAARFRQAGAFAAMVASAAARGEAALGIGVEAARSMLERREALVILDVRLAKDFAAGRDMLPTAAWRDPERLDLWSRELPRDAPILVYCVYGLNVSLDAAAALRKQGLDARVIEGGIAAWHAIGAPTQPKP